MLILEGKEIILKEFTKDNLHDSRYFAWLRDIEVIRTIYRLEYLLPIQFSEVESYVENLQKSKNDCLFAIYYKKDNQFIGTQRIGHIDWRAGLADMGIMIGNRQYWGKGLATDALSVSCDYAFNELSLRKLTGGTPASNIAMYKCFEKIGFKREGSLRKNLLISGKYIDHYLYGLFRKEFRSYGKR